MELKELIKKIEEWAIDRELDKKATIEAQAIKTAEEMAELIIGISKDNIEVIKDSIGDVFVTLVIGNMVDNNFNLEKMCISCADIISCLELQTSKIIVTCDLGKNIAQITSGGYGPFGVDMTIRSLLLAVQYYNLDFIDCVQSAYNEIKDRKGITKNGQFIKEEDLN